MALNHAAVQNKMTLKEMQALKGSEKRNYHDDISLLYINLKD